MGTLSKSAGLHGGYICGTRPLIDLLINRARSFFYSTAPPPGIAAAACEVVRRLLPGPRGQERREQLWKNVRWFSSRMGDRIQEPVSAIVPVIIGGEKEALESSGRLLEKGFLIPAIRFPTVARGSARLRVTFTATHSEADVEALAGALLDDP
jgi:7-keto-8-aminopelargonate synthetase-like enzyme